MISIAFYCVQYNIMKIQFLTMYIVYTLVYQQFIIFQQKSVKINNNKMTSENIQIYSRQLEALTKHCIYRTVYKSD